MTKRTLILFLLLAAAFGIRLWFAAELPVTLDEAWSDRVGGMSWSDVVKETKKDIHPPLTYAAHKIFTVSRTELGVRWFFVLMSSLSIFYILRLSGNSIPALLILGFSSFLILTGAIARMHALNLFFSAGACYHFVKTFEREKISDFVLMSLFSLLMVYNFYPGGALIAAFCAVYLLFRKKSVSRPGFYAGALAAVTVFSLPLLFFFNPASAGGFAAKNFIDIPSGAILAYLPFAFAYSENLMKFNGIRGIKIAYFLLLALPVFWVLLRGAANKDGDLRTRLSLWLALVSVGLVFAVSLKIPKLLYNARYAAWAFPLFACVFVKGLDSFSPRIKTVLFSALIAVNFASLYAGLKSNPENWKEVSGFISENGREKDVILFDAGHMRYPFGFYYSGGRERVALPEDISEFKPENFISYNRIWLILAHNWGREGVYAGIMGKNAELTGQYRFGDIEVLLFVRNGDKK